VGLQQIVQPFQYYAECHGVMFVIDSGDHERLMESWQAFGKFPSLSLLLSSLYKIIIFLITDKMIGNEHLNSLPLAIICNKQDLQVKLAFS